jgi:ABC-type lipoprotein release transport system permease subunit
VGRILLVARLAGRDLRRRRLEAGLLLLAMVAATTTLTLGLVLRDAASDPYQQTREATNGPDVVAFVSAHASEPDDPADIVIDRPAEPASLDELAGAPEVIDHSGPFPVVGAELQAAGRTSDVQAIGRDAAPASVDQPEVVRGDWVRDGGVVVEAAFADALGVDVGDAVTLDDRSFDVVGIAVTAAIPPYPKSLCFAANGCVSGGTAEELAGLPATLLRDPGLVWLTAADVLSLATDAYSVSYVMNLELADPAGASAFVDAHAAPRPAVPIMATWDEILFETTELARDARTLLLVGAWLLGLLAVATVSVLVGGRMADQSRRVGLLKAVGGTPRLVAAVLLAEYVLVAVVAAAVGMVVGALTAPLLTDAGPGLLGTAGTPSITLTTLAVVTAVALGVAAVATFVPAVRAARITTVDALADTARAPRRTGWLIAASARLPVPLLLALRIAARRPRRAVLSVVSIAITVSGLYVALVLATFLDDTAALAGGMEDARAEQLSQVLLVVIVIMLAMAAVNAIFVTWATVLDNRHASALARALGATPRDVSAAVAAAQVLPALAGALLGAFPGGFALFHVINTITGGDSERVELPSLWQLLALVGATVLLVAALTAVPARLGSRRSVTTALQAELA